MHECRQCSRTFDSGSSHAMHVRCFHDEPTLIYPSEFVKQHYDEE